MCLLGGGAKNIVTLMDYSAMTTTIPLDDDDDDDDRIGFVRSGRKKNQEILLFLSGVHHE